MPVRHPSPNEFSEDEDDLDIEVYPARSVPAAGTPPPGRGRPATPVPEPVESGEIVERRSKIIRSSGGFPIAEIKDEPTERTRLPGSASSAAIPVPAKRRLRVLWLVAALAPAIVAGALTFAERSTSTRQGTMALQGAAEMIGTAFDSEARAALVRGEAIASSPTLRAGIETDAATLADMARDQDLVFPVDHGESLEIFQVKHGARSSMLRIPADAASVPTAPAAGTTRVEARGAGVAVVATAGIPQQRSGISGEVVISIPLDLEPITRRLAEQTRQASLIGFAAPIVLVSGPGSGPSVTVPIKTKLELHDGPISLAAALGPAATGNSGLRLVRNACLALAGLLLVVYAISMILARRAQAA